MSSLMQYKTAYRGENAIEKKAEEIHPTPLDG